MVRVRMMMVGQAVLKVREAATSGVRISGRRSLEELLYLNARNLRQHLRRVVSVMVVLHRV